MEVLRETTLNLIDALVEAKVLTRERADKLVREAEGRAKATVAQRAASNTVRVPYVPEVVRNEMREQIKQEVLAQARAERWAEPNAVPEWLDRIRWEGDVRLRYQSENFDRNNTPPLDYALAALPVAGAATRSADTAALNPNGIPTANTVDDRSRLRLRARLEMLAKIGDQWGAGVRMVTGNTTDRVSTNQTLGQNFNKYTLVLDRAYLQFQPYDWLSIWGGRLPNPWFSTDLVWDEDLNFEGLAATIKADERRRFKPYLTVGVFPFREENAPANPKARWLTGAQAGAQWELDSETRFKFGLAFYNFRNVEGRLEANAALDPLFLTPLDPSYGNSQYETGLRQKGNTLFRVNAPADPSASTLWGLASKFRPWNLTASLDLAQFDPVHLVLTADYVRNPGFDRNDIAGRTGLLLADGRNSGYQFKATLGMPRVRNARDWQVSLAYRRLGSDAVLDAFTDSDFALGGSNHKGYALGLNYGVDRNAVLGLRWLSADALDSPTLVPGDRFAVDVFQMDMNLRF